ncbi:MAG: hypothetical protein ABIE74_00350 [Pseudomonadota bacterium]
MKFKKSNLYLGLLCIVMFLGQLAHYFITGSVIMYVSAPLSGPGAKLILTLFGLLGILGVYFLITGSENQKTNKGQSKKC